MPPATTPATPLNVRTHLALALGLDLVGPTPDDAEHASETLPHAPSKWYLTGFLVPHVGKAGGHADDTADDTLDGAVSTSESEEDEASDKGPARKAFFPSSMGLSLLVPATARELDVCVTWGDYRPTREPGERRGPELPLQGARGAEIDAVAVDVRAETHGVIWAPWQRTARRADVRVALHTGSEKARYDVPRSGGLELVVSTRAVGAAAQVPAGTVAVSIFLVNARRQEADSRRDVAFAFQARLDVRCAEAFVPRPDPRGRGSTDWDERVADLQYRDDVEFAVGHNVSVEAIGEAPDEAGAVEGRACRQVRTTWLPHAEVEKVVPGEVAGVTFEMETLAACESAEHLRGSLGGLEAAYRAWIATQRATPLGDATHAGLTAELCDKADTAASRINAGLALLDDATAFEAFRVANRAVATAIRQRGTHGTDKDPAAEKAPRWYPFQLAFILMNLRAIAEPASADREIVDLLFFPTGGGKTEAYLGLAAFSLVLRRLRHPGFASAGVTVLMRYTLRLLTLDQLGRAATLICALELERARDPSLLGPWPFEIGLWVGQAATPNRMGKKGDKDPDSARARTIRFKDNDRRHPSPIPIENCPWCGTKFTQHAFLLVPNADVPNDLRVRCVNRRCAFRGDRPLPILAVDEPIYRRLPCFLIATVDKFASLPWTGHTGALFGKVSRKDDEGFYGPCDPGRGRPLDAPLLPPDLVIQDELHLISGPLGTMVGLYETALDALSTRRAGEREIRPKIVASTATVRRAEAQIRALFGRKAVEIFPPPGPDRRDAFFARTVPAAERNARLYLGVAAQGRSPKVVLLRVYLALLGAAEHQWRAAGAKRTASNPADPYMTLLGYFNSLRELGGSRRIVEDEVNAKLCAYGDRKRLDEKTGPFASRKIQDEPLELTSRKETNEVADAKRCLALDFGHEDRVDVALATNMISVGLDITRLGLMVVTGQPKMAAEYIQTTSRVGRDDTRPGLVVTMLNVHKPRDRSHYERFEAWHRTFYRAVEATSVTPFSPRAIDRGLAAVTVALARLGYEEMTAPARAVAITRHRGALDAVAEAVSRRAEAHDKDLNATESEALRQHVKARVKDLLDSWESIGHDKEKDGAGLQYQREVGGAPPLLFDPLDPDLQNQPHKARKFRAGRSLRDVEPVVALWLTTPDGRPMDEVAP